MFLDSKHVRRLYGDLSFGGNCYEMLRPSKYSAMIAAKRETAKNPNKSIVVQNPRTPFGIEILESPNPPP